MLATPLAKTYAQVAPITPSGLGTQVSDPIAVGGQTQYDITGGTRPGGGANLFHSFGEFGVPQDSIANFLNETPAVATSNILGRVTGGNISSIFGTIQTTSFGNANLFLMNPAGFLFGPNATVNVGGMVAFTSADYLRLGELGDSNAGIFHADPTQTSVLTSVPVAAFGFLGSNPGAITVQGSRFTVTEGTGISLVGGNIEVTAGTLDDGTTVQPARLAAPGGQINLASVASPGEVLATSFLPEPGMTRGTINVSKGSTLDVSSDAAGTVRIRGGQFVMADSTIAANTGDGQPSPVAIDIALTGDMSVSDTRGLPALSAQASGAGNAGEIRIESASLNATSAFSDDVAALIDTHTSGTGRAGNVSISTGDLQVTGTPGSFFFIDSGTAGPGNGSDITINASTVQIRNANINTGDFVARNLSLDSSGSGGSVTIAADSLQVDFGIIDTGAFLAFADSQLAGNLTLNIHHIHATQLQIGALGFGGGGAIRITADSFIADSTVLETDVVAGLGGGITLDARIVELTNGSGLISTTFGDGKAGDIRVTATDHIKLSGTDLDANPTGLLSNSTGDFGAGEAGAIVVTAPSLEMTGGARINTATLSSGRGGDVTITTTDAISISGEFPTSDPEPIFGIGTIHPSGIFTKTAGGDLCIGPCGDAGHISITAGSLTLGDGAQIDSGTNNNGRGGDITIRATERISMSGTLSDGSPVGIFTDTLGTGAGGNILVDANSVTIENGGTLSAATSGTDTTATGGTITVNAYQVNTDGATITVETTGAGQAGSIALMTQPTADLTADAINLNNSLVISSTFSNANAGDVLLQTGSLHVENTQISSDAIPLEGFTGGNAGTIHAQVDGDIALTNSVVSTSTVGNGNAGNILMAGNSFQAESTLLASIAAAFPGLSGGNGGTIQLNIAQDAHLSNSTIDSQTVANGNAGNVFVNAASLTLNSSSLSTGTSPGEGFTGGNAGDIQVTVGQLTMNDGLIVSQSLFSAGNGGMVTVTASESITTSGSGIFPYAISTSTDGAAPFCLGTCGNGGSITLVAPTVVLNGVGLNSTTTGQGNAGNILAKVGTLTVMNGAHISASAENPPVVTGAGGTVTIQGLASPAQSVLIDGSGSGIFTDTKGTGAGGSMSISSQFLTIQNGGSLSATTSGTAPSATGGSIAISSVQSTTLNNGASVTASSTGPGNAGNILINAGQNYTSTDSAVTTEANHASGGNITVLATDMVQFTNSQLNASVQGSSTTVGGNIVIDPQFVILQNSQILAKATQGQGGNISITTGLLLADATSVIDASSQFGVNGTVAIQSPNAPGSGKIQPLGKTPLLATSLLNQHCAALAGGEFSSFTVAGRDSLPTEPGSWLASPLATLSAGTGRGEGLESMTLGGSLAGETPFLSLRQIAPAGFLTQAFALDWSAGCQS